MFLSGFVLFAGAVAGCSGQRGGAGKEHRRLLPQSERHGCPGGLDERRLSNRFKHTFNYCFNTILFPANIVNNDYTLHNNNQSKKAVMLTNCKSILYLSISRTLDFSYLRSWVIIFFFFLQTSFSPPALPPSTSPPSARLPPPRTARFTTASSRSGRPP